MKLKEMIGAKNSIVQLEWGQQIIEFHTKICEEYEDGVIVTSYMHDGSPLPLAIDMQSNVVCNLFADEPWDNKRVSWRNLNLSTIEKKGETYYFLSTTDYNKLGTIDDRRTHERIVVHRKAIVKSESSEKGVNIIVQDISDNGISFYAPNSFVPPAEILKIEFTDYVEEKLFDIKVECKIVRTQPKAGNTFYGCEIFDANKNFLIYGYMKRIVNSKI